MENKVNISNNSVESAGITKDYKEAIAEFVWNGFDANASMVNIVFKPNEINYINEISIVDNGSGINLATLGNTFGSFLDSVKRSSFNRSSSVRGKKGKGRFSFIAFAYNALWSTTFLYKQSKKLLDYEITISAANKDIYIDEHKKISKNKHTGTSVKLYNLHDVTGSSFGSKEFIDYLKYEFGWFLLLNKSKGLKLCINGDSLMYEDIIADNEMLTRIVSNALNEEFNFRITYVRWHEKIGDKFYYYFLNTAQKELFKQLTSFNNNAINFYHSVYVESPFFDNFAPSDRENSEGLFGANLSSAVFKSLIKELQSIIENKQKDFIRSNGADDLIGNFERKGVFSAFKDNKYEQDKKRELVEVIKEIYCIQPKIFKGLNETQEKTSVAFINLLLDSDERENILSILEGIVNITGEERESLALLLKKTSFNRITRTINLIENRFKTIELLKKLVFDLKRFTTERDHIQHAIAENYWLFGEQFHLVTANEGFEQLLYKYLNMVDNEHVKRKLKPLTDKEKKRRPDLFICRQRSVPDPTYHDDELEENIMVELKRPTVVIGKEQLRQIEDYLDFITRQDEFNSQTRVWKFFVISNKIDDYVVKQYQEFQDKGKRYLVKSWGNLEIFAMTWDDLFRNFQVKHRFLLDKLDFDRKAIEEELKFKGIALTADVVAAAVVQRKEAF
ncbi:ATP-binding protein [Olivibacter domesticus]|uniref:Histidine kinase-, DNA gyrase B-, and HSP90-like ATPase n=1 Tax=Olivibacter domesticus TaxID=407022 RepID=A0A1H7HH08_OLID1|nr:ATP-binding protein [Olivibacter domesticus]SEK49579.1 Histidine kinase-, DNA gyrase B-, and HSP90-like ATPase [Olivibacter domesticus]